MQGIRALLIYPKFPDTFWSFKHALPFINKRAALPPLGLATIAAMLPKEWHLRLLDLNVTKLSQEDLAWANYVLISAMTVQRDSARAVIAQAKKAGVKVIAGGPLFTSEWQSFPEVDHLVLNEAEITLPLFLADLDPKRMYASNEFASIEQTPTPRWDLINLNDYYIMSVQWSRGCPYQCEFCDVTKLFGHRPRIKKTSQVIAELDALWNAGWRGRISFVDDNFIGNKKQLKEDLLPALIRWQQSKGHRVSFSTEVSINLAQDQGLLRMMAKAGINTVFIGIETPNEAALIASGKTQNTGRNLICDIHTIQRAGIQVQGGFIVGFDTDPPDIFERQSEFIAQSGITTAMVSILNAPPGTALWNRLGKVGRIRGETTGDNVDGTTNIVPIMGIEPLQNGYRSIMEHIYSPRVYYARMRTFLKVYRAPKTLVPIDLQHFLAFFRAGWHLGIRDTRGSIHYWLMLIWTLTHKPQFFPLTVALAIQGYHFRKIVKRITK